MKIGDKMVMVPQDKYDELLERSVWVDALEAAGVDNWEGYDQAREIYQEMCRGD